MLKVSLVRIIFDQFILDEINRPYSCAFWFFNDILFATFVFNIYFNGNRIEKEISAFYNVIVKNNF